MRICLSGGIAPERAHVVQAVGQLDQHDADVVDHRQEHLAQALRLLRLLAALAGVGLAGPRDLTELGDAVDQLGDPRPEGGLDLFQGDLGVLDHVVQDPAGDRLGVEGHVGQDHRRAQRMHDVRLTGAPEHAVVGADRHRLGILDQLEVGHGRTVDLVEGGIEIGERFEDGWI